MEPTPLTYEEEEEEEEARGEKKKKQGEKEARFASPKGSLDHLLRQVMGLDGLIEARFSSMAAAPHRVPSSSAHCSIKGSFRGESKFYLHLCRAHPNVR